jgi:hypothetical protein
VEIVHFALLLQCVPRLETLDDIDNIVTHCIAFVVSFLDPLDQQPQT